MRLTLVRKIFTPESTIGDLFIDDHMFCHTLEDTVRRNGEKIKNETAIPFGKYDVIVSYSPKFQRLMPLLLNVPNFSGIRIHGGNRASDTSGCIIVAKNIVDNYTLQGSAEKALTMLLIENKEPHFIEVIE
jgi:hypothetical protein